MRAMLACLILALAAPTWAADLLTGEERGEWIKNLRSIDNTNCCAEADGEDVYWEPSLTAPSGYRVSVQDQWYDVPEGALIIYPNLIGKAIVWLNFKLDNGAVTPKRPSPDSARIVVGIEIRCFLPGAAY